MSSTHMYQGLNTDSKSSSRVLRPPGGGHSDIFGVGPAPAAAPSPAKPRSGASSNIFGSPEESSPTPGKVQPSYHASKSSVFDSDPAPAQRNNKPMSANPLYGDQPLENKSTKPAETNPITGETRSYTMGGTGEAVNRPSTRVKQPPGGGSSGPLW